MPARLRKQRVGLNRGPHPVMGIVREGEEWVGAAWRSERVGRAGAWVCGGQEGEGLEGIVGRTEARA
jgi:hypothetical protein